MDPNKAFCLAVLVLVYGALIFWKKRRTEALWAGVIIVIARAATRIFHVFKAFINKSFYCVFPVITLESSQG